jgi:hypothetical protein
MHPLVILILFLILTVTAIVASLYLTGIYNTLVRLRNASENEYAQIDVQLKRRYDFVFFDSPPILGVSDASILASEVDMTLQVIQYRRYPQPMNIRAKQLIEKVGGNLVGIVLNNINMSQDESYYYYSGYYHDYYYRSDEQDPAKSAPAAGATDASGAGDSGKVDIKPKY